MKIVMVFSERLLTKFMQTSGVFEEFKFLESNVVAATVIDDFGQEHIDKIVARCVDQPYQLLCVVGEKIKWHDPAVKAISTGESWAAVDRYMDSLQLSL